MNQFVKSALIGASVGAIASTRALVFKKKSTFKKYFVYPDSDMRNSWKADFIESPNADVDDAEKGLSRLDSTFRSEWQGMGYPQTHRDIENK